MKKILTKEFTIALLLLAFVAIFIAFVAVQVSGIAKGSYSPDGTYEPYFASGTTLQYFRGDLTWQTLPVADTMTFNNAASHTIQTVAAAANGFQLSSSRNVSVFYSVNVSTTATIGGASDGYVALEIAATNSVTASDWKEISRTRNGQTVTLAVILQSVQNIGSELMGIVPAGYYVRMRSVNTSGTPIFTYVSGQEATI